MPQVFGGNDERRRLLTVKAVDSSFLSLFSIKIDTMSRLVFLSSLYFCCCLVVTLVLPTAALNVGSYYLPSSLPQQQQSLPLLTNRQFDLQRRITDIAPQYRTSLPSGTRSQQQTFQKAKPALPAQTPIVRTTSGRLVGRWTRANSGAVVALYLGVPFAKPPVGELRFRKPQHFVSSPPQTIINVTAFAPLCGSVKIMPNAFNFANHNNASFRVGSAENQQKHEGEVRVSEDCLYLNVFVPTSVVETAAINSAKIPVMVWIPGGDWNYIIGSQNQVDAVQFAAHSGVIVVTINYRVGPFGFLTSNDKALPGNYGLYDQAMAIGWVRQNIESFGGDSNEITLFGHSSGAMSISWHLFSGVMRSGNESIFKRAILQSGAYIGDLSLSLTENSAVFTNELGTRLNCQTDNSHILADCLRRVPEEALRRAAQDIAPFGLGPVVDGEFIEDDPFNMLYAARDGMGNGVKINAKDIMIGTVFDEGSLALEILPLLTTTPQHFMQHGLNQSEFDNLARLFLIGWLPQHRGQPQIYDLIVHKYKNFRTGPEAMHARRQNFMDLVGDVLINMGVDLLAEKLSENGARVFAYQFQHRPSWSQYPSFIKAGHGDELAFVFGAANDRSSVAAESSLSNRMMRAWTQFAVSGDPNPLGPSSTLSQSTTPATWLPYGPVLRHYYAWNLQLRSDKASLQSDLRAADIEFWYNVRARLGNFIQQCQLSATETSTPAPAPTAHSQQPIVVKIMDKPSAQNEPTNNIATLPPSTPPLPDLVGSTSEQQQQSIKQQDQQQSPRNTNEPPQTPFYQLPPPVSQIGRKYPVANMQANNLTNSTPTPPIFYPPVQSASFLQTLPAAITTLVPPATTDDVVVPKEPQIRNSLRNTGPWQTSHQYNVVKRMRSNEADQISASSAIAPSAAQMPSLGDGQKNATLTSEISPRGGHARVELSRRFLPPKKVLTTFPSNSSLDSFSAGRVEEQPLSPLMNSISTTATAAPDVVAALEFCNESGWLIGSELSTQQAEIIIGALSVFSLTSLVLIVLLCFAVTGQRRKLRRRKFLLAADPKSATTTLYANHHHQHHQHHPQSAQHYR